MPPTNDYMSLMKWSLVSASIFFYILYSIEDLGLKVCRGQLDDTKHTDSQRKILSMRQVPVVRLNYTTDGSDLKCALLNTAKTPQRHFKAI